jgi:SpoVK/Ycf46/Vps4 family AAA+-type ATPase
MSSGRRSVAGKGPPEDDSPEDVEYEEEDYDDFREKMLAFADRNAKLGRPRFPKGRDLRPTFFNWSNFNTLAYNAVADMPPDVPTESLVRILWDSVVSGRAPETPSPSPSPVLRIAEDPASKRKLPPKRKQKAPQQQIALPPPPPDVPDPVEPISWMLRRLALEAVEEVRQGKKTLYFSLPDGRFSGSFSSGEKKQLTELLSPLNVGFSKDSRDLTISIVTKELRDTKKMRSVLRRAGSYVSKHESRSFYDAYVASVDRTYTIELEILAQKELDKVQRELVTDTESIETLDAKAQEILTFLKRGTGYVFPKVSSRPINAGEQVIEQLEKEFHELIRVIIGQSKVKEKLLLFLKQYLMGLTPVTDVAFNWMLYGPPGTGKTTIATKLARISALLGLIERPTVDDYSTINLRTQTYRKATDKTPVGWIDPSLRGNEIVRVLPADFQEPYVGWTDPKTLMFVGSALGRMLFIDEAYELGRDPNYGRQALTTILASMTEYGRKLGVIMAGYEDAIEEDIFGVNEGFRSRFNNIVIFQPNTPEELAKIFLVTLYGRENRERGVVMMDAKKNTFEQLIKLFRDEIHVFEESNARGIKNLVAACINRVLEEKRLDRARMDVEEENLPWRLTLDHVRAALAEIRGQLKIEDEGGREHSHKETSYTSKQICAALDSLMRGSASPKVAFADNNPPIEED